MTFRRALLLGGLALIFFLALYSWNSRTGALDDLATNVGLEVSAQILGPLRYAKDGLGNFWNRYWDLVGVREENIRLKKRAEELEARLVAMREDLAELKRLRALAQFPVDARWRPLAARVLAGRLGPGAVMDTITISRGYTNGARPGVPLVTNLGLVGRVLRSSARAATALLITDPGSRIAVYGQESRAPGILKGQGTGKPMEVDFVQRDAPMNEGEILVTSGLDDKYPKGLPVARIERVAPSDYTQFMAIEAAPLVDFKRLEEVLLLEKSGVELPPEDPEEPAALFGPPIPARILKAREQRAAQPAAQGAESAPAPSPAPRTAPARPSVRRDSPSGQSAPRYRVIVP
ncbi:MAG: rod shape-determining protein MreC [Desulfovibrio sp.]|nr:rod shape-determining protein MreC [Desulfovibrio sp.]